MGAGASCVRMGSRNRFGRHSRIIERANACYCNACVLLLCLLLCYCSPGLLPHAFHGAVRPDAGPCHDVGVVARAHDNRRPRRRLGLEHPQGARVTPVHCPSNSNLFLFAIVDLPRHVLANPHAKTPTGLAIAGE